MEHLPILQPDRERAARTLSQCHQALARRRLELARAPEPRGGVLERAVLIGFGAIYLSSIALSVIRVVVR